MIRRFRLMERISRSVATLRLKGALRRLPEAPEPEEIVDFLFSDAAVPIQPWQWPEELLDLARLVQSRRPRTVLEIGTADGGTLLAHARLAAQDALLVSIDLPEGPFGGGYPAHRIPLYQSFRRPHQHLDLLRVDSHAPATAHHLEEILDGRRIEYAFIDGDHSYTGVWQDFQLCLRFAAKDAVFAFHDIAVHPPESGCEVHRFWNEVKRLYRSTEFIRDPEQDSFGIGILYPGEGMQPEENEP